MAHSFDLETYLERIKWGADASPTYDALRGLLSAHMAAIPFENLDVLFGRQIRLDLDGLQEKLVRARRGGYCFEHGMLFAAALEALGFNPIRHTARVVMILSRTEAPRSHMFLTVPVVEGTFVVDPGFGALAPRLPVPLLDGVEARTGSEAHWMARDGHHWVLRARASEKEISCWASTLEEDNLVDFEVGNHYVATHPSSPFVNRVMMRALTGDGRVTVMNREVNIRRGDTSETTHLDSRASLRRVIADYFGFDLVEIEQLRVPSIPEWY